MTGHAFQAFLTEADQIALFHNVAAHLAPNGRFAFDSRNPAARQWLEWTRELSSRVVDTAAYGAVEIWNEARMNPEGILDVVEHYRILSDGKRLRSDFRLLFSPQGALVERMAAAGLAIEHCYGDWDRQIFTDDAREIIMVARSAA